MPDAIIPALTVPASRSHDGLDHIIPEQAIAHRKQPRWCTWCAVEFVPRQPSGSRTARLCSKSCAQKRRRSLQLQEFTVDHLKEVILDQVGRLTPRSAEEIWRRVWEVWGDISDRAVQRHLSQLYRAGRVARTPDGYLLVPSPRTTEKRSEVMSRFVRLFRYDPVKDPTARLRIDYDPQFGNAVLSDENAHLEQVDNPDANHIDVLGSMQLTTKHVRWLAETMAELAGIMEDSDREAQEEVDRLRMERDPSATRTA